MKSIFAGGVLTLIAAAMLTAAAVSLPVRVSAQQAYPSPEAAADAFVDAVSRDDAQALETILGANWTEFIPTDDVDRKDVEAFLAAWKNSHKVVVDVGGRARLVVGKEGWTLPLPIVDKNGGWAFDTEAGAEEIRIRRIGDNELSAMQAVLAYYDAQIEYAMADRNGDDVLEYSQRFLSSPGRQDGLYWETGPGEPESPLGPFFGEDQPGTDYHGYYFKILTTQGAHATGGAYDYHIADRLVSGFAIVAWPVDYDETGVMTFILSHEGQIYEKNLGPDTDIAARAMTVFDPDDSWRKVSP